MPRPRKVIQNPLSSRRPLHSFTRFTAVINIILAFFARASRPLGAFGLVSHDLRIVKRRAFISPKAIPPKRFFIYLGTPSATSVPMAAYSPQIEDIDELWEETILGFVGCLDSGSTGQQIVSNACDILLASQNSTQHNGTDQNPGSSMPVSERKRPINDSSPQQSDGQIRFARLCLSTAIQMCNTGEDPKLKRKQSWNALQDFSRRLQPEPTSALHDGEANTLAISFLFGALGLMANSVSSAKAASSALSSTVSRNKVLLRSNESKAVAQGVLRTYLTHASHSNSLNLNILTYFAKAFKLSEDANNPVYGVLAANVLRNALETPSSPNTPPSTAVDDESSRESTTQHDERKQRVAGALALACQIRPWNEISPVQLVEAAIPYDFWHAAELVCQSASSNVLKNGLEETNGNAVQAVENLIDAAFDAILFRKADNLATNLYLQGGKSRYILARYLHACDTIAKVINKRQLPIIERQVERVDKAIAKVHEGLGTGASKEATMVSGLDGVDFSPSSEIRNFAIAQLEEAGEVDAAQRLAVLWGLEYAYDPEAISRAAEARRKKYVQFEEVLPGTIPDVISDPATLREAFGCFWKDGPYPMGPIGIDAEWGEDSKGVDLLQLCHLKQGLLIDVRSIASSLDGATALRETIGTMMESPDCVVVGFACRQDFQRLRGTPCAGDSHWLQGLQSVVDVQKVVVDREPKLAQRAGLSRVCQHYFGKPLDKAEQCSFWAARPLSERQRSYAVLDAWVCAAVYDKIFPSSRDFESPVVATNSV